MTTNETRIITLTGRAPVRILEADWPVVASAEGDSSRERDFARRQQAFARRECDRYHLLVRRHADGRTIVYGVLDAATAWTGSEDYRGGEMLDADGDVAAAIRRVGDECGLPDSVIRECIADLPPVDVA